MRNLPRGAGLLTALVLLSACETGSVSAPAPARSPQRHAPVRPAATPAAKSPVPGGTVDPTRLSSGPDPELSWYDLSTHTLHHGARTTVVRVSGTVESITEAGDSDLLGVTTPRDRREVVRLDADGATTVLARGRYGAPDVVASADGSTFAWVTGNLHRALVLIGRTSDGRPVTRRTFPDEQLDVLDLTTDRALVRTDQHTSWWNLAENTTETISRDTAVAASAGGDHLALRIERTGRSYVTGGSARQLWSLPPRETAIAFSPDARSVLTGTAVDADERGYDVYQQPVVVRDSLTGAVRARFDGRFGWYDVGSPRWEDDDHFLSVARDLTYTSGQPTMRRAWVRCSTTSDTCETTGPLETPQLDVPPYGLLGRLVAGPVRS